MAFIRRHVFTFLATSHISRYLFRPDDVLEYCHVIFPARGVKHRRGMLLLLFVIFLLAALDGLAPAVANDLACADVYTLYYTRGACRERRGKSYNTSQHQKSLHRYSRAVSPAMSHPSSSRDVLCSPAPSTPSYAALAQSHRQLLRAADEIGPVCDRMHVWDPGRLVYVEVQQGGSPAAPNVRPNRLSSWWW